MLPAKMRGLQHGRTAEEFETLFCYSTFTRALLALAVGANCLHLFQKLRSGDAGAADDDNDELDNDEELRFVQVGVGCGGLPCGFVGVVGIALGMRCGL